MSDLAADLHLHLIDRIAFLRTEMASAVAALEDGRPQEAKRILSATLQETDVGAMKVWQPGEEPF